MSVIYMLNVLFVVWCTCVCCVCAQKMISMFSGNTTSYTRCNACGNERSRPDVFVDVSLNIQGCSSLLHSWRAYIQAEVLDKGNKVHCGDCGKKQASTKGMYVCVYVCIVAPINTHHSVFC